MNKSAQRNSVNFLFYAIYFFSDLCGYSYSRLFEQLKHHHFPLRPAFQYFHCIVISGLYTIIFLFVHCPYFVDFHIANIQAHTVFIYDCLEICLIHARKWANHPPSLLSVTAATNTWKLIHSEATSACDLMMKTRANLG